MTSEKEIRILVPITILSVTKREVPLTAWASNWTISLPLANILERLKVIQVRVTISPTI